MAVVGLGYVGLPLACAFAEAGFQVIGLDVSRRKVDHINAGGTVTPDVSEEEVRNLLEDGRLRASLDFSEVSGAGLISICVPTPLSKSKDPDISFIVDACESLLPHVRKGTTLVLESTTYPGTTREVILPRFQKAGFEVGRDFFLAFSPERVDPGNKTWNIKNTPKVIGGITKACGDRARKLYGKALERIVPVSSAESAEMVKLLENTFRAINIGLVNELAMVCHRLGLSVWEVLGAAGTKPFGFMAFEPGPGLGGHCIPIDPLYLSWKMRTLDFKVRFIDLADEVNSEMPRYVVSRIAEILNRKKKPVMGSSILMLGVAYKRDVDDVRESPALDLFKELRDLGAELVFHDPHVEEFTFEGETIRGISFEDALSRSFDLVLITTGHSSVEFPAFVDRGFPILDTRNVLADRQDGNIYRL